MLLDFYCTLVDLSDPVRSRGFDDFARRLGLPLGPGELYRRYTEMFGREPAAGQFAGAYADMHATAAIFPEVPDALRALTRHFRMGVVANADHGYLMRCLDHNGLRFDLLVDSETARCYKPEPRIFQRACDALSVPAGEAVMVGDTPETDVRGAHRAGLRAVWLNRDHRDWPRNLVCPDAAIDELGQLPRFLRQLDPQAFDGARNRPGTRRRPGR